MSDEALIRLSNLKAMGETPTSLMAKVGKTRSYWSDLLRGQKSFGEKTARNIEEKLGLRRGALDQDSDIGHTAGAGSIDDSGVTKVTRNSDQPSHFGEKDDTQSAPLQEIPTTMNYAPDHLRKAILLMGSLLGALDGRSRKTIGGVLNDLANAPDEAPYFASIAVTAAKEQQSISSDDALDKALKGRRAVETSHGLLR